MRLLAIDPGTRLCGWAVFEDGRFAACGLVRTKQKKLPNRIRDLTNGLKLDPIIIDGAQAVVIERPQVYERRKQKGDPNDLIALSVVVGAVAQAASPFAEVLLPLPSEWKGSVSKEITKHRTQKALSDHQRWTMGYYLGKVPKSLRHNAIDAVALGLWGISKCS